MKPHPSKTSWAMMSFPCMEHTPRLLGGPCVCQPSGRAFSVLHREPQREHTASAGANVGREAQGGSDGEESHWGKQDGPQLPGPAFALQIRDSVVLTTLQHAQCFPLPQGMGWQQVWALWRWDKCTPVTIGHSRMSSRHATGSRGVAQNPHRDGWGAEHPSSRDSSSGQ